ncbi:MAG: hypothetical protein JXN60_08800 [Lentisphaerae bacterium]|nr:hypothetical protein [Lentisphaerota bacterium]
MTSRELDRIVRRMVETLGHATQSMGFGRVLGQIYAHLYFSRDPQCLDSITMALGISKGSASMGVRQLQQWKAIRKIKITGDRKDYYESLDSFGTIIKSALHDLAGKSISNTAILLYNAERELASQSANYSESISDQFIKKRIQALKEFQTKAEVMWQGVVVNMLFKQENQ